MNYTFDRIRAIERYRQNRLVSLIKVNATFIATKIVEPLILGAFIPSQQKFLFTIIKYGS